MNSRKSRVNWSLVTADLTSEEEAILAESKKKAIELASKEKSTWRDLPPILDPNSLLTQAILDGLVDPDKAKPGDTYIRRARNVKAVRYTVKPPQKHEQLEEENEEEIMLDKAWEVWIVLKPDVDNSELEKRKKAIHEKYVKIYRNNPEYRVFYEEYPSKPWPDHPFPNGKYYTERFVPKVWNEDVKRWVLASPLDCKRWREIPNDKKRIDYLWGILTDFEGEDE